MPPESGEGHVPACVGGARVACSPGPAHHATSTTILRRDRGRDEARIPFVPGRAWLRGRAQALGSSAAWQSKLVLPIDGHQGETVPWLQRRRGISLTR